MAKPEHSQTGVGDTSILKEEIFLPSTLESIDQSVYNWINDDLDLSVNTNEGFTKVPVNWVSAERSYQIKKVAEDRDLMGTLILPRITVERTTVEKKVDNKGSIWGNAFMPLDEKGGSIVIARRINQDKTQNFLNAQSFRKHGQEAFKTHERDRKKVVYQTVTIPIPTYLTLNYKIYIRTEYQEQMNSLVIPFMTRTRNINYVNLKYDKHTYEGFIKAAVDLTNNVGAMDTEERKYESVINFEVLGYIIGDEKNKEGPKIIYRENAVEVKIPREKFMVGDMNEFIEDGTYREL